MEKANGENNTRGSEGDGLTIVNRDRYIIDYFFNRNINQLDALNFIMSLFHASTCFEHYVLIVRRPKLYYIAYGIITPIGGRPVHRLRKDWIQRLYSTILTS